MFQISVVIFREFLEIIMLLTLIASVMSHKVRNLWLYIALGSLIGLIGSVALACFAPYIAAMFDGYGQEVFNSSVILISVVMLSYTMLYSANYSKQMAYSVKTFTAEQEIGLLNRLFLVLLISAGVFREGAEIVLFIYSIFVTQDLPYWSYLAGFSAGAFAAILFGVVLYQGLFKASKIFNLTSAVLMLVISGLASEAVGILARCGLINFATQRAWDSSWLIEDFSLIGQMLKALISYHSKPSILEVLVFSTTFILLFYLYNKKKSHHQ